MSQTTGLHDSEDEGEPIRRTFVPREKVLAAFASVPQFDAQRFRADLDEMVNQDPTPRG